MAVLNMLQEEQLKEIGTHLRQVRQQQSISIEEVAARTCIRLRMLTALEDGLLDQLPEPIYIQGFIRRYGDFLGLDGNDLAKDFSTDYPPVEFDAGAILGIGRSQKPESNIAVEPIIEEPPIVSEVPEITQPASTPTKAKLPYIPIILFAVVALGGWFYFLRPRTVEPVGSQQTLPATGQSQPETRLISPSPLGSTPIKTPVAIASPTPTQVPIQLSPSPTIPATGITRSSSPATEQLSTQPTASPTIPTTTAPGPTPTPTEPASIGSTPSPTIPETTAVNPTPSPTELPSSIPLSNTTTTGPVQVSVNLQGESWVRVMVDGKTAFEGILQPGTQQTWAGQEKVTIRSGNAGAVLVSVNQNTAQPLGRLGAVREQTFTAGQ